MRHLVQFRKRARRLVRRLLAGRDRGTVAITFLLSLLVFIPAVGITVQYALWSNARLAMRRAMAAAARSAMVALPTDANIDSTQGSNPVQRAAFMVLESVSPQSPDASGDAAVVASALESTGLTLPPHYAERFAYAQEATAVSIQRINADGTVDAPFAVEHYERMQGARVRITVTYQFRLTVPMFNMVLGTGSTVAGVPGRFLTMTMSEDVQLSDGREANSDLPIWP